MKRDALDDVADEIATLAAHRDAATHRLLKLIRRYDESYRWAHYGMRSCAAWLGWRAGIAGGAAREKVRVARALAELPLIDAALEGGAVSYSKTRALTRVATPGNEATLLHMAQNSTAAQLERICHGLDSVLRAADDGKRADRPSANRWVTQSRGPEGTVRIEMQLLPDEAARVLQAIDAARDDLRSENISAETPRAESQSGPEAAELRKTQPSRADAVVRIAEEFLAAEPSLTETECDGTKDSRDTTLFLHLETDLLSTEGSQTFKGSLDDGTRVRAETLRRLACDSGLVPTLVEKDAHGRTHVLDVGRKTRSIPPAIRRALHLRDRCCRFPGCQSTHRLHGHHIEHWLHGGHTKLPNLVLLCPFHHRLVHEEGFQVETLPKSEDGSTLLFRTPGGLRIEPVPVPPTLGNHPAERLKRENHERGHQITPRTNFVYWDGAAPDYSYCVGVAQGRS